MQWESVGRGDGMEMASAAEVVPAVEMVKEFLRDPGPTAVTPLFSMVVRQVLWEFLCLHNPITQRTLHPLFSL